MNTAFLKILRHTSTCFWVIGIFNVAESQDIVRKTLTNSGVSYNLVYNYTLKGRDTLANGNYHISKTQELKNSADILVIDISGQMKNGFPQNNWRLRLGTFKPNTITKVQDYNLAYSTRGTEVLAQGPYEVGKKTGPWTLNQLKIDNSVIVDTLFSCLINYDVSTFNPLLKIKKQKIELQGIVNDELFLSGIWHQTTEQVLKEKWYFENQCLKTIELFDTLSINPIEFFDNRPTDTLNYEIHELSEDYLQLMRFILSHTYDGVETQNIKFFEDNLLLQYHQKVGQINPLFQLIQDQPLPENFKIKIPVYPISTKDSMTFEKLSTQIKKVHKALDDIQNDIQIKALKDKMIKLTEYTTLMDSLRQKWINPLDTLLEYQNKGKLKYFNLSEFIHQHIKIEDSLDFKVWDLSHNYTLKSTLPKDTIYTLETLLSWGQVLEKEVLEIKNKMLDLIKSLEKKESLMALESALMEQYEELKQQLNAVNNDDINELAGFYVYDEILAFLEQGVREFLSLEDEDQKLSRINTLSECFEDIGFLILRIEEIPQDFMIIDKLYINTIFNPYTFTNMEERRNPGIYSAFQYTLLPALFGKLRHLDCAKISTHRKDYDILFQGMVDLLNTPNKKVERYVKRTREPQKIVDLLGIKIDY